MKLADLRFQIQPQPPHVVNERGEHVVPHGGGAWLPVSPEKAAADASTRAYIRFERRPVAVGETYRVRHPGGHLTDELRPFPLTQTRKIVGILHHPDGTEQEFLHYGGDAGEPLDTIPGYDNH